MHSAPKSQILWASIFASAVVAGLVTILIEYLAKPRLEARKERILDTDRRRREAIYGLRRATELVNRLSGFKKSDFIEEAATRQRIRKWAGEVEQLVDAAYVTINAPSSLSKEWRYIAGYVTGFLAPVQDEDSKVSWNGISSTFSDLDLYLALFTTPRWHWRRRQTIIKNLLERSSIRKRNRKQTVNEVEDSQKEAEPTSDRTVEASE